MSKPRKLGIKSTYIPNAKADMRRHKKVYQRGREKAFLNTREQQREKVEDQQWGYKLDPFHSDRRPNLFSNIIGITVLLPGASGALVRMITTNWSVWQSVADQYRENLTMELWSRWQGFAPMVHTMPARYCMQLVQESQKRWDTGK